MLCESNEDRELCSQKVCAGKASGNVMATHYSGTSVTLLVGKPAPHTQTCPSGTKIFFPAIPVEVETIVATMQGRVLHGVLSVISSSRQGAPSCEPLEAGAY